MGQVGDQVYSLKAEAVGNRRTWAEEQDKSNKNHLTQMKTLETVGT